MQNDHLRAALERLDLAPGTGWSEVLTRYRHLAKVWHPDKFRSKADKAIAEEKIKQIISARELLYTHYHRGEHQTTGWCICWGTDRQTVRPQYTATPAPGAPGPPHTPPPGANPAAHPRPSTGAEPPPTEAPPPTSKAPPPPQSKSGESKDSSRGKSKTSTPKAKNAEWDWRDELCQYLDIGPLSTGEPPWLETFRRMCDGSLGKHPGEKFLDVWDKPPTWTKEHKRKCLLIVFFTVVAIDKIATAIDPDAFKSPEQKAQSEVNRQPKPTLPLSPLPVHGRPDLGPAVDLDSPDEIRKEEQYFEQKWQEREQLLERIRPGHHP